MTKTEKAVSWGLTSFFGVICLAAAPQLSVGLFIKYGILSTALGFGITAISNAVGKAFPDDDYNTYSASGSRTTVHHHHHDNDYTAPRHNHWWFFGNSYPSRHTPPQKPPMQHISRTVEPVIPSYTPSASSKPPVQHINSRVEHLTPSYTPSAPSNTGGGFWSSLNSSNADYSSKPDATPLGNRIEML